MDQRDQKQEKNAALKELQSGMEESTNEESNNAVASAPGLNREIVLIDISSDAEDEQQDENDNSTKAEHDEVEEVDHVDDEKEDKGSWMLDVEEAENAIRKSSYDAWSPSQLSSEDEVNEVTDEGDLLSQQLTSIPEEIDLTTSDAEAD